MLKKLAGVALGAIIGIQTIFGLSALDKPTNNISTVTEHHQFVKESVINKKLNDIKIKNKTYEEINEMQSEIKKKVNDRLQKEYIKEEEKFKKEKAERLYARQSKKSGLRSSSDGFRLNRGSKTVNNANTTLVLTFYTSLAKENGGWADITSTGKRLTSGFVASGKSIPFGTTFESPYGNFIVEDRMSEAHASDSRGIRLDVFIPRNGGESDYQYERRVNNMGVKVVKANVIKWGR